MPVVMQTAARRKRYRSVAVLLALFVSPVISMLYVGRGQRALVYLLLTVVVIGLIFPLASAGYWPVNWSIAVFLIAIVGAVDSYRIARQHQNEFSGPWYSRWYGLLGLYLSFAVLAFSTRAFIIEPFRIPSGAMMPTLLIGDYILVNKYIYGIRMPIAHNLLIRVGDPQRGDVMVFRYPDDPRLDYIKRVVGIPGDRVAYRSKQLYVNDTLVQTEAVGDFRYAAGPQDIITAKRLREKLGEREHEILIQTDVPSIRLAGVRQFPFRKNCEYSNEGFSCTVPAGHYLTMGDNRDNSSDSRYWGFVPERNIIGRAFMVWWNDRTPERTGTSIR
jgi:signal peptidase I